MRAQESRTFLRCSSLTPDCGLSVFHNAFRFNKGTHRSPQWVTVKLFDCVSVNTLDVASTHPDVGNEVQFLLVFSSRSSHAFSHVAYSTAAS